jgi:hypothetical protein
MEIIAGVMVLVIAQKFLISLFTITFHYHHHSIIAIVASASTS